MSNPLTRILRRRLGRVAVAAAVVASAGAISVAAGQHTQATGCATNGQVYLTSVSPWSIRTEDHPSDGNLDNYQLPAGGTSFRVGGNGLRPGTTPYWTLTSSVTGRYVFFGRAAEGNCVANEVYVRIPRNPVPGEVWTVTANYDTGSSGRPIRNQSHYRITFVAPPTFPPLPCFYCR